MSLRPPSPSAALLRDGWTSAILRGATWFVIGIAILTFLWTYGSLLLGLHRLGRERLLPDAARVDPSLGVQPLGEVAFTGLWILLAALVPVLLTGLPDVAGVAIGALVLGGGLAGFFLSLVRLHHQMAEVKASELETARQLYAEAYSPVREAPTLATLEQQRQLPGCCRRARGAGTRDSRVADRRRYRGSRGHDRDERRRDHDRTPYSRPARPVTQLGGLGGTGLVAGVPLVVVRQGRREPQYWTYWGD